MVITPTFFAIWPVWPTVSRALSPPAMQVQINKQFGTISRSPSTPTLLKMLQTWEKATDGIGSTSRTIPPHYKEVFDVIYQKRVRGFHQGFQTPRNRWKHETPDETQRTSFWDDFSNETIKNMQWYIFLLLSSLNERTIIYAAMQSWHIT